MKMETVLFGVVTVLRVNVGPSLEGCAEATRKARVLENALKVREAMEIKVLGAVVSPSDPSVRPKLGRGRGRPAG